MTLAVAASDDTPVHASQPINITVTGAASNTATGYNTNNYPASPELRYYFSIEKSGSDSLRSEIFSVGSDGTHTWPSVIIPSAGVWTARLRKASDDSSAATATITAS
jgi:hypothetical protein